MQVFEKIHENIYRLTIPYKDIFTTVYLLKAPAGYVLFDAASFDEDIEQVLYPAICRVGVTRENLKYVFISHAHTDHAGGLGALMGYFPKTTVVSRSEALAKKHEGCMFFNPVMGDMLLDTYCVISIPGHTADSAALLDVRTNTLITGDCLQLYGIFGSEDWGANISLPAEHVQALRALRETEIDEILAAHDYHPYNYHAKGKEAVERYIRACEEPLALMCRFIRENPTADDEAVRLLYNASKKLPTVRARVIGAVREALLAGEMEGILL